tara:strand:- start:296 stop:748 length:453 start_codon:yes stop_codon:yes gene_type:complete
METIMKYLLLVVIGFISFNSSVYAETVINYDDGSTYTLSEREKIFISTGKLFSKKNYKNGNIYFTNQAEHSRRDHVAQPTDGLTGHEWCEAYEPWSEGLTFAMVQWQRGCDTNSDGVYDMCDYYEPTGSATFEELEWQDKCNDGQPWEGS